MGRREWKAVDDDDTNKKTDTLDGFSFKNHFPFIFPLFFLYLTPLEKHGFRVILSQKTVT